MRASCLLIAAACGAMLAGCATTPASPLTARLVAEPSRSLVITRLRAEQRGERVVVNGRVMRRTMMHGAVWGHLHVEALAGATVVAWADTRWSRLARHRLPTSFFQALLPVAARDANEFRVSHMLTGHDAPKRSGNSKND